METVKFTANEIALLKAIVETGQHEGAQHYMVEDLVKYTGKSVNSIKGILASLNKKGIIYCYAGEYAFDGEICEEVEDLVNNIINPKVNPQNNKTENDMEMEDNKNPMMDERIVYMNEISATKLSAVSKGKRENLKAQKVVVKFLMENWDNVEELDRYTDSEENKVSQYKLWCIAKSRLDQLNYQASQRAEEEEKRQRKEKEQADMKACKIHDDKKAIVYRNNMVANDFQIKVIVDYLNRGYKAFIESWCTGRTRVQQVVCGTISKLKEAIDENSFKVVDTTSGGYASYTVKKKDDEPTSETTPAAPVTEKSDKTTTEPKAAASKHRVGDLHPNGKWIWLETSSGKFDWRVIGSRRHKEWLAEGSIIPNTPVVEKKPKTPKTKSTKKEKAEKPIKVRTIEEILATKPQGISKPQERVFKLLRKGYRFSDKDDYRKMLFLKKGDAQETTTMDIATALMRRLKVTDEEFKQFHV